MNSDFSIATGLTLWVRALRHRRTMSTTMTLRFEDDVEARLDKLAGATQRSKSFLAAEAMREFVRNNESQIRDIRAALKGTNAGDFAADEEAATVAMLAPQPGLGRPGRVSNTRELVVLKTRYIVPYRVRGHTVEVLRVFHFRHNAGWQQQPLSGPNQVGNARPFSLT